MNFNLKFYFIGLMMQDWQQQFFDSGYGAWQDNWIMNGKRGKVANSSEGMSFYAGKEQLNDSCHAVLWTKISFQGDIKIEFDFNKLDDEIVNVNILYIQATSYDPKERDVTQWSTDREIPAMEKYFDHMNLLHISYAAFDPRNTLPANDYIRARRCMPALSQGLKGTEFGNSYEKTGLFAQGVPHHISVIKKRKDLYMKVSNDENHLICHWNYADFPLISEGRIGLRHMYSRDSRYKNFSISTIN